MKMQSGRRALDKIYKRRDRYEIPEWQRDEVWATERKQLLIDTILRGWKLSKFYLAKTSDSPEEFEVVDGQQRLTTIFEFFDGALSLSKESAQSHGGATYAELPDALVDQFDDYEIEYDVITDHTEKELKEFFQRLQGGLQLTASEKLNSIHSNLTNFVRKLAKHEFFQDKVWMRDTRKAHFDIVSKVAAIEVDGLETGLRYEDLKETFEAAAAFSPSSNVAKRLRSTFDHLNKVFPEKSPVLRNRSTIQSFATLAILIVDSGSSQGTEDSLRSFFDHFSKELSKQVELGHAATDPDYLEFQRTLSANVKAGAKTRHQILLRKLLLFDPSFADVLGPAAVSASGMSADIKRLGDSVATLVGSVNEQYSAVKGTDLIKPTNKTASALQRIAKPIKDFDGYKSLVDDLYFLFHEGVGQRLAGKTPTSFQDVNALRTALQHDVDHGKSGNVAAKRKKLAAVFQKYAAASSPAALAPERFPVVQANLLRVLEADLKALHW
jgi:hypothetical protein